MRLEPMTEERFRSYREEQVRSYAQEIEDSGVPHDDAVLEAEKSTARLLPNGLQTPNHHIFVGLESPDEHGPDEHGPDEHGPEEEVGQIWVRVVGRSAFIFDLGVRADVRRRGYGRQIMRLAEQWCREQGVTEIGLNVFAHNPGARALYEQLGFAETRRIMRKKI
jgi:GNAT superfamily N-acetyltransferase